MVQTSLEQVAALTQKNPTDALYEFKSAAQKLLIDKLRKSHSKSQSEPLKTESDLNVFRHHPKFRQESNKGKDRR